ncbi:MAG: hypothetical protein MOGMAGMI_00633 [Candidatus Omnitrophica bacterium]|nr:hypothetical protein [Candidatus Omnitrophota bacterium]
MDLCWLVLGKALTYGCIGLFSGWSGRALVRWTGWEGLGHALPLVSGVTLVLAGLVTLGALRGLEPRLHAIETRLGVLLASHAGARRTPGSSLAAGMLWGLLPCPMVLVPAVGAAIAGGAGGPRGAYQGFFIMVGFGLGTAPALFAGGLGLGRLLSTLRGPTRPVWPGAALIAAGGAFIYLSLSMNAPGHPCH